MMYAAGSKPLHTLSCRPGMRLVVIAVFLLTGLGLAGCRAVLEPVDERLIAVPGERPGKFDRLPPPEAPDYDSAYPEATAVLWAGGHLWTANESGLLTRWNVRDWDYQLWKRSSPHTAVRSALKIAPEKVQYSGSPCRLKRIHDESSSCR